MLQYDCISDIIIDIINNIIITGDLKNMKKVLSILLCLLMAVSLCPFTALADATQEIPSSAIQISSVDDLAMICNEYPADGYYCLTCDIDMTDALGEYGDYYNDGKGWEPIGNKNTPFTGTFDGMGHTIKGLYINRTSEDYVGLFGYVSGATIKNCKLEAGKIKGSGFVGGFVGYAKGVNINKCNLLQGNISYYGTEVGGIVGCCYGELEITECTNNATISNGTYTGGIIGYVSSPSTLSNIQNCLNNGSVSCYVTDSDSRKYYAAAGGIIGSSHGSITIRSCRNNGIILRNGNCYNDPGGILGYGESGVVNIISCINFGKSIYSISGVSYYKKYRATINIENCYNFSSSIQFSYDTKKNCYSIASFTAENGTIWDSEGNSVTRTNKQMRIKSNYSTFDFDSVWSMDANPDFPYPSLQSNPNAYKKTLTKISIAALPTKTNYLEGKETLDLTGALLRLTYDNDTFEKISITEDMVSGFDNTVIGTNSLKIKYGGFETSMNVTIIKRSLSSIEIMTTPTKTEYLEGKDSFDPTDGVLKLKYNNDTTATVPLSEAEITGFDNTVTGEQILTVSYGGKTTTLNVTITPKTLERIEVSTLPNKTKYLEGKDALSKDGGVLTLYYNNDKSETVNLSEATVTGFNNKKVGTQTLTVYYMEKTAQFDVEITAKSVTKIAVTSVPDTVTYLEGKNDLSAQGGKLTVYYNNSTEESIDMTVDMFSGFDADTVGMQTITVTYGGKTAVFEVEVIAKTLEKIEMLSSPAKTTYRENKDTLNLSGAKINLVYNNDTVVPMNVTSSMVSGFDNSIVGKQNITVTYQGKTTQFEVEIIAKTAVSIKIKTTPTTFFAYNAPLDVTGGIITVYYDNDTSEDVKMTADMVTGYDSTNPGASQTLTVTYLGRTTTYDVMVDFPVTLTECTVLQTPVKTEYNEGDELDYAGLKIRYHYSDNSYTDKTYEELVKEYSENGNDYNAVLKKATTGYDKNTAGSQTVKIYLPGYYCCEYKVNINHIYSSTTIKSTCSQNGYILYTCTKCGNGYKGETLDLAPHTYSKKIISPTCTEQGYTEYTCRDCGYSYKDSYTAQTGHNLVSHSAKAATCTEKGWNAYSTCSRCNYTNYSEIAALGHNLVNHEAKATTCTEKGWNAYTTCSKCNYTTYSEIAALGHNLVNHEAKAPTCTEKGWNAYSTCSRCNYTTYSEIAALGHNIATDAAVAATCAKTGLTEGKHCTRCGTVTAKQQTVAKLNHTYDSGKITTAPAIGVAGVRTYTCTKCGATKTETIAPLSKNIEVKTTANAKMLSDGIIVTVNAFTADELIKNSNGTYVSNASGEKVASNAPLATGMKLVLESGSEKQERQIAVLGDVDCDGTISVNDARSALRAAVKLDVLTGVHLVAAKVMGESEVTVSDARLILRAAVKLETGKDWINNIK